MQNTNRNTKITGLLTLILCLSHLWLHPAAATTINPLFSPTDKPTKKLIELINNAKTSIHAAVYMLTDKTIAEALIAAHNNNHVAVNIIVDQASLGQYGKVGMLTTGGISVYVFNPQKPMATKNTDENKWANDPIMHNKFAVIDGTTVWTGSFNWTVSANRSNAENVVYFNDAQVAKTFEAQFNQLLKHCIIATQYSGAKEAASLREKVAQALQVSPTDAILLGKLLELLHQHTIVE